MKKILFAAALAVSFGIILSACKNPPIFAAIEQEVKLNPASVKGLVRGIVRIGNTLYTSNGKIFYKSVGARGKWSEMGGCPSGLCTGLATDGANLYASFGNKNTFKTYKYADSKWTALPDTAASAQYIFGTDTVFAFEQNGRGGYTVYPIKNGAASGSSWSTGKFPVGAAREYCLLEDGLYNKIGSKVAGSPTSGLRGICEGSVNAVFVFDNGKLYCYDGSSWTSISHGVANPQSITYLPNKQLVLIGGIKGYGEIKLGSVSDTNLGNAKTVSAGSAESSVPSTNIHQYNNSIGKYVINPINAFDHGAGGYIIYVGINDPNAKYTGLWGFYSPDRIEWNRE